MDGTKFAQHLVAVHIFSRRLICMHAARMLVIRHDFPKGYTHLSPAFASSGLGWNGVYLFDRSFRLGLGDERKLADIRE